MQHTPHTNSYIDKLLIYIIIAICILLGLTIANKVMGAGVSTSGKTVSDIQTDIRRQFNEYTAVFLNDTSDLLDWINYATYDIVSKTHCMESDTAIALVSGTTEYSWSGVSDYITIKSIIYNNNNSNKITGLLHADIQMLGNIRNTGEPKYWYDWNDKIGIYPTADAARSGHSIYIYYIPKPEEYESTGEPIYTPAIYDNTIINYCIYKAVMKDRRYQEAGNYLTEYNNTLQQYRVDLVDKQKEPREITNP